MKKVTVFSAAILGLLLFAGIARAEVKMAYVDLSRIFDEYTKRKSFDAALEQKGNTYKAERDKRLGELKQIQEKLNLLSEKESQSKRSDLEAKAQSLQEYDREKQTDLRKEQEEKMQEVLKDIEEVIKQYAEKQGYNLVFNNRVLIYESKDMDITDKIIEILNAKKQ